jgi:hypothetical protein
MSTLAIVTLALVAGSAAFVLALILRRVRLARLERRRLLLLAQLRPAAIALLEGEPAQPPELSASEADVFAELLSRYARSLRGPEHGRIAAYFESIGAVDAELRRLRSPLSWRRGAAAFALGDMGAERAVPELLRMLEDHDRDVRNAAVRSLGRLRSVEAIEPLVAAGVARRVPRAVANAALFEIGPAVVPRLRELSTHPDPAMRADAVELLGLLGDAGDAGSLLGGLRDRSERVREASADALGRLGAADARDALIEALHDGVPSVRAAGARALGQLGGDRAAAALLAVAREPGFAPASAAARALARIDPQLVIQSAREPGAGPHLLEAADLAALWPC